jgi:hypothetical protein
MAIKTVVTAAEAGRNQRCTLRDDSITLQESVGEGSPSASSSLITSYQHKQDSAGVRCRESKTRTGLMKM